MVRFRLFCRSMDADMRMEMRGGESVGEVGCMVTDYFGDGYMLRNGYSLLAPDREVGDCISEGDLVEAIPDPETLFRIRTMG